MMKLLMKRLNILPHKADITLFFQPTAKRCGLRAYPMKNESRPKMRAVQGGRKRGIKWQRLQQRSLNLSKDAND